MSQKMYDLQSLFHHFILNSWTFESKQSARLISCMSDEEKVEFNFDPTTILWTKSYRGFMYGLRKFYVKEDIPAPELGFKQMLAK